MSKVKEAQDILKSFGLPAAQQNEISAYTLLALCGIKENGKWSNAVRKSMRVTKGIMLFIRANYKKDYAPNTRETFRRQVIHQLVQARIVDLNPDNPKLPVNSPNYHYAISREALEVIKAYNTADWEKQLDNFISKVGSLIDIYEKKGK